MSAPEIFESYKQFGGRMNYYRHDSKVCKVPMKFTAFIPPSAEKRKLPVLYWLSGLTCNWETFMLEGHGQAYAKAHDVILVGADTSPRETGIPDEERAVARSFYVDATEAPWAKNFQMETYITKELREVVEATLPARTDRRAIFGHSMGGHGALVLGLRNPELYHSVSAFAPISSLPKSAWGVEALTGYLGADRSKWTRYDASEVLRAAKGRRPVLIDQGDQDEFLSEHLHSPVLEKAIAETGYPAQFRYQAGYDHSYFFISSFVEDHIAFHAKNLAG